MRPRGRGRLSGHGREWRSASMTARVTRLEQTQVNPFGLVRVLIEDLHDAPDEFSNHWRDSAIRMHGKRTLLPRWRAAHGVLTSKVIRIRSFSAASARTPSSSSPSRSRCSLIANTSRPFSRSAEATARPDTCASRISRNPATRRRSRRMNGSRSTRLCSGRSADMATASRGGSRGGKPVRGRQRRVSRFRRPSARRAEVSERLDHLPDIGGPHD